MVEPLSAALITFVSLISAAFTKIMIIFLTVLMVFFFIPQSRIAAMLGLSIASSILGGMIVHMFADSIGWGLIMYTSMCIGLGFSIFPIMMIFSQFYRLLAADKELHEEIYRSIKAVILKQLKGLTSRVK